MIALTSRSTRTRYAQRVSWWSRPIEGHWRDRVEAAAIRKFGTTDDLLMAGYVLPDGTMLDFRRRMGMFTLHSEVGEVLQPERPAWREDAIRLALDRGWVRIVSFGSTPSSFGVEFSRPITAAQQRRIHDGAEHYNVDDVYIEVIPTLDSGATGEHQDADWDGRAAPFALPKVLREANLHATPAVA